MSDDLQEMAREYNDDEAIWRCYERKRKLRLPFAHLLSGKAKNILDQRDWLAADREARPVRVIGKWIDR